MQPVIIGSGVVGWQILKTTYDRQIQSFSQEPELNRDIRHFEENIGGIVRAEDLVNDRQLLKVALGAFGLENDLNNRFFILKMLEEGTTSSDSLANRFADSRYREFSEAFGLGASEIPKTLENGFAERIVERYRASQFEVSIGNQDESLRIALFAERKLPEIAEGDGTLAQKWFSIMGQPPLRSFFETAFGLPSQFSQVDIDRQLEIFESRAEERFGSRDPSALNDREVLDDLITSYMARSQLSSGQTGLSSSTIALTLLQF